MTSSESYPVLRAGSYALVDGVEHQAMIRPEDQRVRLILPVDQTPSGPGWTQHRLTSPWTTDVPRTSADRLFHVTTWAMVEGRFPVRITSHPTGGTGRAEYRWSSPAHGPLPAGDPIGFAVVERDGTREGSVRASDLTDVHEIVVEHPLTPGAPRTVPAGAPQADPPYGSTPPDVDRRRTVRAGQYAVVDGVEHQARVWQRQVELLDPGYGTPPDGAVWDPTLAGAWTRTVPRSLPERLVHVDTWALLHGEVPVRVHGPWGVGQHIVQLGLQSPVHTLPSLPRGDDGQPEVPPGFTRLHPFEHWTAVVDTDDLRDVHSFEHDLARYPRSSGYEWFEVRGAAMFRVARSGARSHVADYENRLWLPQPTTVPLARPDAPVVVDPRPSVPAAAGERQRPWSATTEYEHRTDEPLGCETCRSQAVRGLRGPFLVEDPETRHRLWRCGTCRVYWEVALDWARPLSTERAHSRYLQRHPGPAVVTRLDRGMHATPAGGLSLTEAVALAAGEPHSSIPDCLGPELCALARAVNDLLEDHERQALLPLVPQLLATSGDGLDAQRGLLRIDWTARVFAPAWLDLGGMAEEAARLRELDPVLDVSAAVLAAPRVAAVFRATTAAAARARREAEALHVRWPTIENAAWQARSVSGSLAATRTSRGADHPGFPAEAVATAQHGSATAFDAAHVATWRTVQALDLVGADSGALATGVTEALATFAQQMRVSAVDLLRRAVLLGR